MTIKLFTMVKDENDIVREWIIYHGELFGYENIFVIDNYSTDGTYEIIQEYKGLINIGKAKNYKDKGILMKSLINKSCLPNDIAFPIDIDEFIVYYDNNKIISDKTTINNYMNNLRDAHIYKANYIVSNITDNTAQGYKNAIVETKYGTYQNYDNHAKSFFKLKNYNGAIDHGNHIHTNNYFLTKICLVHYHCRNLFQMKKKIYNNVIGLGYPNNLEQLKIILHKNAQCAGNHHVRNYINLLENTYQISKQPYKPDMIELDPLSQFISKLK
jgi:hypothetical protein